VCVQYWRGVGNSDQLLPNLPFVIVLTNEKCTFSSVFVVFDAKCVFVGVFGGVTFIQARGKVSDNFVSAKNASL
jgi:hypothetical protein